MSVEMEELMEYVLYSEDNSRPSEYISMMEEELPPEIWAQLKETCEAYTSWQASEITPASPIEGKHGRKEPIIGYFQPVKKQPLGMLTTVAYALTCRQEDGGVKSKFATENQRKRLRFGDGQGLVRWIAGVPLDRYDYTLIPEWAPLLADVVTNIDRVRRSLK